MSFRNRIVLAAVLLTGCSSDGSQERLVKNLTEFGSGLLAPAEPIQAPAGKPFLIVSFEGATTPMVLSGQSGDRRTFDSPDNVTMTMSGEFLARLRGVGREFEAFYKTPEGPDFTSVVSGESYSWVRNMEYWKDQNPKREKFRCFFARGETISGDAIAVNESCVSIYTGMTFNNLYIVDSKGKMIASEQWFFPDTSPLVIDHTLKVLNSP